MSRFTRRSFLTMVAMSAASATLGACTSVRDPGARAYIQTPAALPRLLPQFSANAGFGDHRQVYAATFDDGYDIPAVPIEQIDPNYYRQVVPDPTGERPGTVVIDTSSHFLYVVVDGGEAIALRRRARPSGFRVGRPRGDPVETEVAALVPAE